MDLMIVSFRLCVLMVLGEFYRPGMKENGMGFNKSGVAG